ncbi:piwi-like protein Siwi isoform X1 [Linepithema humile]|uniref:piwi-like protein Siwi isoform X1 n=2 Tax=Linepithema humile TaxID=83485 RepID=UPI00351E0615
MSSYNHLSRHYISVKMSQRGRGTRGRSKPQPLLTDRSDSSRSSQDKTISSQQQLPHSQSTSSGQIRRPGQPTESMSTGRGMAQRIGERGDSATIGQIGRGLEHMTLQHGTASGGGDASVSAGTVAVSSTGRGAVRGKRILLTDILVTKPSHVVNKKGSSGSAMTLQSNYFKLLKSTDWAIHQYHVYFAPEEDRTAVRKGLLKLHKKKIGAYIFDGSVMYTTARLAEKMTFTSIRQSDEQPITITVRLVADMLVGDYHYIQFFNIIMRKCFEHLDLKLIGRNFFDPQNKIVLPEYKLELWPGYITSIRQHERDILMCSEITNKVMRLETLLDIYHNCMREDNQNCRTNFINSVVGTVVLTQYNNNTYRIEDVDFSTNPCDSFSMKNGEKVTYMQYYKKKYGINLTHRQPPLLIAKSRVKGSAAEGERIYLLPELCRATGMTDNMRENYKLMSCVATYTRLNPQNRIQKLLSFNKRLQSTPNVVTEFTEWNLQLDNKLLDIPGRLLNNEVLTFGGNATITPNKGDWSREMQNKRCLVSKPLKDWILIVTERDKSMIQNFISTLTKVSRGVAFDVDNPTIEIIRDDRPGTYNDTLERILSKRIPQLVFCVVSNNRSDRYSAIKKKCYVDRPVASQVCLSRTLSHKNIMSIATKIAIQMNCKLGGAPWRVEIPLDGLMIVGFDVCHDTMNKSKDFGATVASLDRYMTRYYSTVNAHTTGDELSTELAVNISKAARVYGTCNKTLPSRILIYRDGVGEGQVSQVLEREVGAIQKELNTLYGGPNYKLGFIIVTKRLNTRLFLNFENPPPGTVVDDVITSPIRYDFFIVSQQVRQGTVTPTSYSVILDNLGLDPDKMQRLTYKLTHMYYNCSNTVRVPAPCHYAHKLAFLVSRFIHRVPDSRLQNTLYFL